MTLTDDLTRTAALLAAGWPIQSLNRARRVAQEKLKMTMTIAQTVAALLTPTTIQIRHVDGAGRHINRNVPGKRVKAAHRKIAPARMPLKAFAKSLAKSATDGPDKRAAIAWLNGKES